MVRRARAAAEQHQRNTAAARFGVMLAIADLYTPLRQLARVVPQPCHCRSIANGLRFEAQLAIQHRLSRLRVCRRCRGKNPRERKSRVRTLQHQDLTTARCDRTTSVKCTGGQRDTNAKSSRSSPPSGAVSRVGSGCASHPEFRRRGRRPCFRIRINSCTSRSPDTCLWRRRLKLVASASTAVGC